MRGNDWRGLSGNRYVSLYSADSQGKLIRGYFWFLALAQV